MKPAEFLPRIVLEHDREKPWQALVPGTVLFADVSGFTPMSEALSVLGAEGAELLTDILNRYFAAMIGIVHAHGGQVMKFGGDAILCFFPETGAGGGAAPFRVRPSAQAEACGHMASSLSSAFRAAGLMQGEMARFQHIKTPVKRFALKMKIGVAHGEVLLAGVGDPAVRCDYVFAGAPVDATSDAEHHAAAGEIVLACNRTPQGAHDALVQNAGCKMEEIEPGFYRVLEGSAELEGRDPMLKADLSPAACRLPAAASQRAAGYRLPAAVASYLIREVHQMVSEGYAGQVGALLPIAPVFMQFEGFQYTRGGFDLQRFHEFFCSVMEITHRYAGRLNRISMGDKGSTFFLLFGAPTALEKKEERAAQWALDIRELIARRHPGVGVRIGMNAGRVFCGIVGGAGRWEYTVMGDAVNLAARLMQGAQAGQICASRALAEPASAAFAFEDLGARRFKGKAEPLPVFALRGRGGVLRRRDAEGRLVGRSKEMQRILARLREAGEGRTGLLVLEGEAGMGKSFLARRALEEAERGGWWIGEGRGEITRQSHPYSPWADLLRGLLAREGGLSLRDLEEALDEKARPYLAWHAEWLGLDPAGAPAAPVHDEETRKRLFQHQLAGLVLGQAGQRPLLLFLDDLHWFDTLSLELLAAVLNQAAGRPLFILAASRPEWEKGNFLSRADFASLPLGELDREGVGEIALALLGGAAKPPLLDYLLAQTRGNPFLVCQTVEYLRDEGLVEPLLGEWTLKRGVERKGVLTGAEVVAARVARLPLTEQRHLRFAACLGPTFSLAVLKRAMGAAFSPEAVNSLLASGYWIEQDAPAIAAPNPGQNPLPASGESAKGRSGRHRWRAGTEAGPSAERNQRTLKGAATSSVEETLRTPSSELRTYAFPHALVQEAIYRSLLHRERRRLHRRIAAAMEAECAGDLDRYSPNLANHYHLAGRRRQAVDWAVRAGRYLLESLSCPEACAFYARAYGLLRFAADGEKHEVGLALAEALLRAGRLQEGKAVAAQVGRSAARKNLPETQTKATIAQFKAMWLMSDYGYKPAAERMLRQGASLGEEEVSQLRYLLGGACYRTGSFEKAEEHFRFLIKASAPPGDAAFRAYAMLADMANIRSRCDEALNYISKGIEEARLHLNTIHQLNLTIAYATVCSANNKLQEAEHILNKAITQAEQMGDYYILGNIYYNKGKLSIMLGNLKSAERYLSQSIAICANIGIRRGHSNGLLTLGVVRFHQGHYLAAYSSYMEAVRMFEDSGEVLESCWGYYNLAEVCLKLGRVDEARRWHQKGLEAMKGVDNPALRQLYEEIGKELE